MRRAKHLAGAAAEAAIDRPPAGMTTSDLATLLVLATFLERGDDTPTIQAIAKAARLSERGTRNCLDHLVRFGWLRVERRRRGLAPLPNKYTLTIPPGAT